MQLRQVLRRLARAPTFTIITLVTLAGGVGANTVVFSVLEGVLLKPLQYPRAEELIGVWLTAPQLRAFISKKPTSRHRIISSFANRDAPSRTLVSTQVIP
jgi:hypothetical protein